MSLPWPKYTTDEWARLLGGGGTALAEWDESQHPRADDGKFTNGAGGGTAAAPKVMHLTAAVEQLLNHSNTTGETLAKDAVLKALEPAEVARLQSELDRGKEAMPEFTGMLNKVADTMGVKEAKTFSDFENVTSDRMFAVGPVKGLERTAEKVVTEYGGDIGRMKDIVRSTFVVKTPEEAHAVVDAIKEHANVFEVKDNFAKPMPGGYRDMKVYVQLTNGTKAEVKVGTAAMMRAANTDGHKIYEELRATPQGTQKYHDLLKKSEELYNSIWNAK